IRARISSFALATMAPPPRAERFPRDLRDVPTVRPLRTRPRQPLDPAVASGEKPCQPTDPLSRLISLWIAEHPRGTRHGQRLGVPFRPRPHRLRPQVRQYLGGVDAHGTHLVAGTAQRRRVRQRRGLLVAHVPDELRREDRPYRT